MVNLVRRFKLEYNDASTGTTTIAETGQDTGALKIDRHVHFRRVNDPDILKLWLEGTNFGDSIPTRLSEFGTAQNGENEPEILYKQYDEDAGSFQTIGRFYAKNSGTINEDGELALKLYSFMKYTSRQSVDTGTINGDIEDALNAVLPQGYVADVPAGVTPPSVSNYSLNTRREKGFQELTRNYNYSLTFTSELDGSNNYKVKFEPEGFGGSVDTVDSSTDPVVFKSWQKDKQDSIVNKVTVEGTNSNGTKIQETATNQTQIDNFGEKFRKYKVGYVESSSEAQEIAENYLVPGLDDNGNDITKVPESGTIKTVVYSDNIVNDSLNIIDSTRNIDDTYTVVQQRNYWPEGASELELEFEKEDLEEAARDSENLRDERGRLYPESGTDVGQQGTSNMDTGSANAQVSDSGHDNHGVLNSTDSDNAAVSDSGHNNHGILNSTDTESPVGQTLGTGSGSGTSIGTSWNNVDSLTGLSDTGFLFHRIRLRIDNVQTDDDFYVVISDDIEGFASVVFFRDNVRFLGRRDFTDSAGEVAYKKSILLPSFGLGSNYYLNFHAQNGTTVDWSWQIDGLTHDHAAGSLADGTGTANVSDSGHGHASGTLDDGTGTSNPSDSGHGDPADPSEHGVSGTTDSKNINVATEDKTDR